MRWKLAFRTSPCHVERATGPGSSLRARSAVKELGYKVTDIWTWTTHEPGDDNVLSSNCTCWNPVC